MLDSPWFLGITAFISALIIGTFVEYLIHRLMHLRWVLGNKHTEHHAEGTGQGWLGEFWDYFLGSLFIVWWGVFCCTPVAIGWAAGILLYACCAAYAHQVQHENPELVFWMPRPVHHLHHAHNMWRHNFGITVDWWDRIFGTYRPEEWKPEKRAREYGLKAFFQIKWF